MDEFQKTDSFYGKNKKKQKKCWYLFTVDWIMFWTTYNWINVYHNVNCLLSKEILHKNPNPTSLRLEGLFFANLFFIGSLAFFIFFNCVWKLNVIFIIQGHSIHMYFFSKKEFGKKINWISWFVLCRVRCANFTIFLTIRYL